MYWGNRFWRGFHEVFQQYNQEMAWHAIQSGVPVMLELPEGGINKAMLQKPKSHMNPGSNKSYPAYGEPPPKQQRRSSGAGGSDEGSGGDEGSGNGGGEGSGNGGGPPPPPPPPEDPDPWRVACIHMQEYNIKPWWVDPSWISDVAFEPY